MRPLLSIVLAGLFATVHSARAESETSFRDFLRKQSPVYEKLWRALEVLPLEDRKQTVLRIYDDSLNLTFSALGDRVVIDLIRGTGEGWPGVGGFFEKGAKDSKKPLAVSKLRLEIVDAGFALDLDYLVSHLDALNTDERGLDGGTTYFDAISKDGRFTTFEVWSPQAKEHPLTCELLQMFYALPGSWLDTMASKEDWEDHDYQNFQMKFLNVSSLGLTREAARGYLLQAFQIRIHKLVNAIKSI